jgi:DNA-directed RNA polymerase subunit RPC12/RpoP
MTTREIYPHQLPDSPPSFVVLHCSACDSDYSADRGDYFLQDPGQPMICECGFRLFIVTRKTVLDHDKGREWLQ